MGHPVSERKKQNSIVLLNLTRSGAYTGFVQGWKLNYNVNIAAAQIRQKQVSIESRLKF